MKKDAVPQYILLMQEVAKYLLPNQKVPNFGPGDMELIKFVITTELREMCHIPGIKILDALSNGRENELRVKLAKQLHFAFGVGWFLLNSPYDYKPWMVLSHERKILLEAEIRAGAHFLMEQLSEMGVSNV